MYSFNYRRAQSINEARDLLAKTDDAKLLSGGMTLIPTLKQRLASPAALIDLAEIKELRVLEMRGDKLFVGAAMRHVEVATSALVKEKIPALAYLASQIGDPQVRNRGTMGGSVANNDPAADYPSAVLGLGATVVTTTRQIAADDFFKGVFETALEPGEIITGFLYPLPKRAAYSKFPHPASGYAMTGVFVVDTGAGIRVAVTGAGPGVFRWKEAEAALGKSFAVAAVAKLAHSADGLNEDMHASGAYRANLIAVMCRRALASITGESA